ncbi:MAG TPA: pitrilysin family protein [Vicinamibacterales bacterium]|nr:pitrilysin family protein [Vicinamibacterales bacterium]
MRFERLLFVPLLFLAAGAALAQAPDRTRVPVPGPAPELRLPEIQKRALSNGLQVWIVEQHEVPVVQVSLVIGAGGNADPAGKPGLASMTAAMLDEGAGQRSALEIADAIDFLGASLATSGSFDASAVRLWVPVSRLADALPVMSDVAIRPTFPPDELERLRKERLTAMLQARDDPAQVASLSFPRFVFGQHRYGTSLQGTPASVGAFTPEDLRSFYEGHYRPERSTLVVVGDVKTDEALRLLESAFGGWKGKGPAAAAPALPEAPRAKARQVFIVDKPGAPQSQIVIGAVGVPRSTPDYFPLQVLNTLLGGSFTSRLNQNLREEHGYTYGARSAFDMRLAAGPFLARAGVQTEVTAEALTEFFKELNGVLEPIPPDELSRAKNYVALGFPSEFETTGDIAARLEELIVYELPKEYYSSYVERIQAVTAQDVRRVAQRYITPDRFTVVVVGDRKAIEAPVRGLKLGPVTVMSADEALK